MESIVLLNKPEGFIEVKASGSLTQSILENQMDEIIKIGLEAGVFKVLVDFSKVTELPPNQSLIIYTSNYSGFFIYATHGSLDKHVNNDIINGVDLSVSGGLVVRHFPERNQALAWLKKVRVCK